MATGVEIAAAAHEAFGEYGGSTALLAALAILAAQVAIDEDAPPELRDLLIATRPDTSDDERLAAYRRLAGLIPWKVRDPLHRMALGQLARVNSRSVREQMQELLAYGVGAALAHESQPDRHRFGKNQWVKDQQGEVLKIPPDELPWGFLSVRMERTPSYKPIRHYLDWLRSAAIKEAERELGVDPARLIRSRPRLLRRMPSLTDHEHYELRRERIARRFEEYEESIHAATREELSTEDVLLLQEARVELVDRPAEFRP